MELHSLFITPVMVTKIKGHGHLIDRLYEIKSKDEKGMPRSNIGGWHSDDDDKGKIPMLVAEIRKNGSAVLSSKHEDMPGSNYLTGYVGGVVQLNGSSDYLEMFTLTSSGSTRTLAADSQRTFFGAYRVV